MINRDWEKFGEDIRKTVQNAIDSQDFGKLNQTITDTINNAVDSVSRNIRNAQEAQRFQQQGRGPTGGQDEYQGYQQDGYQQDGNRQNGSQRNGYQHSSGNWQNRYLQNGYQHSRNRQGGYQQSGYQQNGYQQNSCRQPEMRSAGNRQLPALYRQPVSVRVKGTLTTVLGAVTGSMFSIALLFFVITAMLAGAFGIPEIMVTALFLMFAAAGFIVCGCGRGILGRAKRFRAYMQVLGQREYCNIRELADKVHKNARFVVKDLEYMFSKGWFLEGHLDDDKTCLITSHGMYRQYKQIQTERRQSEQELAQQRVREQESGQEQAKKNRQEENPNKKENAKRSKLPPEVQRVIDEGDTYIRKIHACNDAIPGEEISAKISHMEMLVDKIFDRVEQDPDSVDDIRRLMEYYLPTTVKLLEAYQELDAQPVDGENIRSSKREIEATLDTLNTAFEKLLDGLFQETAWDVSSDISVLHTMLAQEGLTDDGLRRPQ